MLIVMKMSNVFCFLMFLVSGAGLILSFRYVFLTSYAKFMEVKLILPAYELEQLVSIRYLKLK